MESASDSAMSVRPSTVDEMYAPSSTRRDRATFSATTFEGYPNWRRQWTFTTPQSTVELRACPPIATQDDGEGQPPRGPPRTRVRPRRDPRDGGVRGVAHGLVRDPRTRTPLDPPLAPRVRVDCREALQGTERVTAGSPDCVGSEIAPARFELASQAPKARRLDRYPTGLGRTKGTGRLKNSRTESYFTRPIPVRSSSEGGGAHAGTRPVCDPDS